MQCIPSVVVKNDRRMSVSPFLPCALQCGVQDGIDTKFLPVALALTGTSCRGGPRRHVRKERGWMECEEISRVQTDRQTEMQCAYSSCCSDRMTDFDGEKKE